MSLPRHAGRVQVRKGNHKRRKHCSSSRHSDPAPMSVDQIAEEAADKLSCPPRCSCAGSHYSMDGKQERQVRTRIIKSAIEKVTQDKDKIISTLHDTCREYEKRLEAK